MVVSMYRVFSCVVGRGCLLWPVHSLGKTLLAFALLHSLLPRASLPVTPGVSWLPTFAFQSPIMKRTSFWVLVLKGLVGLHRTVQLQLLQCYWLGYRHWLGHSWITVILNGLPWKQTEIILSFVRLHPSTAFRSFVDHDGYSISSQWFLPTVVDIMVIWVKFTHSSPFYFADS